MATTTNTVLKTPTPFLTHAAGGSSLNLIHYRPITTTRFSQIRYRFHQKNAIKLPTRSIEKLLAFASDVDNMEAQTETHEKDTDTNTIPEPEENTDSTIIDDSLNESDDAVVAESTSAVLDSLRLYKEALSNNDEAKLAEVESFLKTIETEKIDLANKLETLLEDISNEKARLLRTSVEFDIFRKSTDNERVSLVTNAKEAVLEVLLPVMDDFERAKAQIKVENEGEEKVNNSYQSIYKQFAEILGSLQAVPVEEEKMGKPSDPVVTSQAGSRFSRVIDEVRQKVNGVYSGFTKKWIRK